MDDRFRAHLEALHASFDRLIAMTAGRVHTLPRAMPSRAVYLLAEGNNHLYVGRTNRLRQRLLEHGRRTSGHTGAGRRNLNGLTRRCRRRPKAGRA